MRPDLDAIRTVADRLATQDNAGTSDPFWIVYSGRCHWKFHAAFLTSEAAKAWLAEQAHNLPKSAFVYCESAHSNAEIKTLRRDIPALLAYVAELEAQNAAAVLAWEEYAEFPDLYGSAIIGRVRYPDGREEILALRADQVTGLTRGIEKHIRNLMPHAVEIVEAAREAETLREQNSHLMDRLRRFADERALMCEELIRLRAQKESQS